MSDSDLLQALAQHLPKSRSLDDAARAAADAMPVDSSLSADQIDQFRDDLADEMVNLAWSRMGPEVVVYSDENDNMNGQLTATKAVLDLDIHGAWIIGIVNTGEVTTEVLERYPSGDLADSAVESYEWWPEGWESF